MIPGPETWASPEPTRGLPADRPLANVIRRAIGRTRLRPFLRSRR